MKINSAEKWMGSAIFVAMLALSSGHALAQVPTTPAAVRAACAASASDCARIVAAAIAANPAQADEIASAGAAAGGDRFTAAGPDSASAN